MRLGQSWGGPGNSWNGLGRSWDRLGLPFLPQRTRNELAGTHFISFFRPKASESSLNFTSLFFSFLVPSWLAFRLHFGSLLGSILASLGPKSPLEALSFSKTLTLKKRSPPRARARFWRSEWPKMLPGRPGLWASRHLKQPLVTHDAPKAAQHRQRRLQDAPRGAQELSLIHI